MASWTSRGLSPASRDNDTPANMNASQLSPQLGSQILETDPLQHAYGIPLLYPSDHRPASIHGRREPQPSRHGRSMSHPFPSIFHSKKKRQEVNMTMGYDTGNGDVCGAFPPHSPPKPSTSKSTRAADRDLMTGKCMTCDSMVRWPKELAVFRCTVCLMINDLTPIGTSQAHGADYYRNDVRESTHSHILPLTRCKLTLSCV